MRAAAFCVFASMLGLLLFGSLIALLTLAFMVSPFFQLARSLRHRWRTRSIHRRPGPPPDRGEAPPHPRCERDDQVVWYDPAGNLRLGPRYRVTKWGFQTVAAPIRGDDPSVVERLLAELQPSPRRSEA